MVEHSGGTPGDMMNKELELALTKEAGAAAIKENAQLRIEAQNLKAFAEEMRAQRNAWISVSGETSDKLVKAEALLLEAVNTYWFIPRKLRARISAFLHGR